MTFTIKSNEARQASLDGAVSAATKGTAALAPTIHPTDRVDFYRKIEKWAGQKAVEQEKTNDRDGVPE